VTGLDLVAEQIRIAEGEALGYTQADLALHGHAVECRVYAEDPANNFLPDPGRLLRHAPPSGFGVRVDAGVEQHGEVLIHYDPMIAKLTTWGRTRAEAIRRMDRALAEYDIAGVETTLPFCRFVMQHEAFRSGAFSTHFIAQHFDPAMLQGGGPDAERAAALAAVLYQAARRPAAPANNASAAASESAWRRRRRY
jgi:propionyl-CoA carboxylase alpha chain